MTLNTYKTELSCILFDCCIYLYAVIMSHDSTFVPLDVKGAQELYDKLQLVDYLGENVSTLASAALKYLKITNTDYAMNIKTGSKLLTKVSKILLIISTEV